MSHNVPFMSHVGSREFNKELITFLVLKISCSRFAIKKYIIFNVQSKHL